MNLTTFCRSYNLSYEIVRPLIDTALLEHRDDCVLIIGKQKIRILNDKKFIEFINDIKRRELCQTFPKRIQRDFVREKIANTIFTTTTPTANAVALQLEKRIYGRL
jgi:hypothetical protein